MNILKWSYPETGTECLDLMNDGYRPHGGGTFLVKTSLNIKGLFDLSRIPELMRHDKSGDYIILGAALTYYEAGSHLENLAPGNFISRALLSAAATPLRNRITIGGSICAAPKWSDIQGPLSAAGASVIIAGEDNEINYSEYAADRKLRQNSLVTAVSIPLDRLQGLYYRFTVTGFDYPLFTITVSEQPDRKKTCSVTGTAGGVIRFEGDETGIMKEAGSKLVFNDERGMSGGYLKTRALAELKRLINGTGASNE